RVQPKLTPVAKAEAKHKRDKNRNGYKVALEAAQSVVCCKAEVLHAKFGAHSVQYYKEEILQFSRLNKQTCQPSQWNAYLCVEIKRQNTGAYGTFVDHNVADCGIDLQQHEQHKVHDLAAEIAKTWNAMTPEEQKIVTHPLLKDLQEQRDSSTFGHL
ncbi:hypothetical protein C0992_004787, partial [Termitomyces sp. T32_za158]